MRISEILNERVGPHNMREVELLLDKKKPAAIIHGDYDMKILAPYIKRGDLVKMKAPLIGWLVAQKEEAWRLPKMHALLNKVKNQELIDMAAYHQELGTLLGYDQKDIDFFINKCRAEGRI